VRVPGDSLVGKLTLGTTGWPRQPASRAAADDAARAGARGAQDPVAAVVAAAAAAERALQRQPGSAPPAPPLEPFPPPAPPLEPFPAPPAPPALPATTRLCRVLEALCSLFRRVPLAPAALNEDRLIPRKDYESEVVTQGLLQVRQTGGRSYTRLNGRENSEGGERAPSGAACARSPGP
jgi:hypothetical protein